MEAIKYHTHGGYYGDGNSHYWWNDFTLDVENNTMTHYHEETFGGQLRSVDGDIKETTTRPAVTLDDNTQDKIIEILQPLIETAEKYPHRTHFKFFSDKHKHFFIGRAKKAIKLAEKSDYYGEHCLHDIFVLPKHDKIISVYFGLDYKERYNWKIKITNLTDGYYHTH